MHILPEHLPACMRQDAGSTHVLEATVILIVMMFAVVHVVTFEPADSSLDASEDTLMQRVTDQARVWNDLPYGNGGTCEPRTQLERLVYEGLDQDHAYWERATAWTRPAYEADMVLDNGPHLYPLHGAGDVLGSAYYQDWWPRLDYTLPTTSVTTVTGAEALVIDLPAVRQADLPRLAGEAVRTDLTFTSSLSPESMATVWSPTALLPAGAPASERREGVESAYWSGRGGGPFLAGDALQDFGADPRGRPVDLVLRLSGAPAADGGQGIVPAGTRVSVVFPPTWESPSFAPPIPIGWETASEPTSTGTLLRATLTSNTPEGAFFFLSATPPRDPTQPFDVIRAKLGGGSLGESNLIVTYPVSVERNLPRVLLPTTPYPVRAGSWAVFGSSFFNGGEEIVVKQVDIRIPGGYDLTLHGGKGAPLFAGIRRTDPELLHPRDDTGPLDGEWTFLDGRHVRWTHPTGIVVPALKAAYWAVPIEITSDPSVGTGIHKSANDGPNATLTFENGFTIVADSWGKNPGILRARVPPATRALDHPEGGTDDGYPWRITPTGVPHEVDVHVRGIGASMRNTTTYTSGPLGADAVSLESAITNASLTVTERAVPIGSKVRVDGDLSSLLKLVDQPGVETELVLDLYSPPSLGCEPTRTWRLDPAILPASPVLSVLVDEGTPHGIFAGTQDGYVQRLDGVTARPTWTKLTAAGNPLVLQRHQHHTDDLLLVGTLTGKLLALDPLRGGTEWTRTVLPSGITNAAPKVTVIVSDPARGRILAGNDLGHLLAWDADGSALGHATLPGSVRDVKVLANGDVLVLAQGQQGTLRRLDPTLATTLASYPTDGDGFALGATRILLATSTTWLSLDPLTLQRQDEEVFGGRATRAASGDATGDGVEDLVLARDDLTLHIVDGATLATRDVTLQPSVAGSALSGFQLDSIDGAVGTIETTPPCDVPQTYAAQLTCPTGAGSPGVLLLAAGKGRVTLAYSDGLHYLMEQRDGATGAWSWGERVTTRPTALAQGAWPTDPRASAWGDEDGLLTIVDDQGVTLVASRAGDRVGRFSFHPHVPEGGFYGAHLLVARLLWGNGQEARLTEWFEATDARGAPVARPFYGVVFTVDSRDYPHPRP